MQIDLTADETARLCRLLHLANDPADAALWEKLKTAHVANLQDCPACDCPRQRDKRLHHSRTCAIILWEARQMAEHTANEPASNCGRRWAAEIELCPRCGLSAAEHLAAPLADPITGHVIELSPVQTSVAGLTDAQTQDAYAEVARRYALRAAARSRLDRATQYAAVLTAAHAKDWKRVNRLLGYAGVIS